MDRLYCQMLPRASLMPYKILHTIHNLCLRGGPVRLLDSHQVILIEEDLPDPRQLQACRFVCLEPVEARDQAFTDCGGNNSDCQ